MSNVSGNNTVLKIVDRIEGECLRNVQKLRKMELKVDICKVWKWMVVQTICLLFGLEVDGWSENWYGIFI